MKILVTGGAGYIGSHMVKRLHHQGHTVVTFDNLSTGCRRAVRWGEWIQGDLLHPVDVQGAFEQHHFDAVIHFAARAQVAESIREPGLYYRNNVAGSMQLLETMRRHDVTRLIFSSSAAVYGHPLYHPLDEQHPLQPIHPYGHSKRMVEQLLQDYATAHGIHSVSLRYFNAAGADPEGDLSENHQPETHLIPNLLRVASGQDPGPVPLYGDDYPTADGTCVRDYVHVVDLCAAHLQALDFLLRHPGAHAFNLGNGQGFSVKAVHAMAEDVVGRHIPCALHPRRAGDPPSLVADSHLARERLGWSPQYADLSTIIQTAWYGMQMSGSRLDQE